MTVALHPHCIECKKTRLAKKDGPKDKDGVPLYKAGEFIIRCSGIPLDHNLMPNQEKIQQTLSPEEFKRAKGIYSPTIWGKDNFNWDPRIGKSGFPYQELMTRCTAKRKVYRLGRRLGKTNSLGLEAAHFIFNNSPRSERWDVNLKKWVHGFGTVLIVTPFLSQIKLIFNQIRDFMSVSPELNAEVVRDVSTPYHILELKNGSQIIGFTAGANNAKAIRGQKADLLILDEMDYLDEGTMDAIIALLMEHSDVNLIGSSTPSGREGYFFSFCKDRMDFKEFHVSSYENPSWNPTLEAELRETYRTETAWKLEIEAEFIDPSLSVFQSAYIDRARGAYDYGSLLRDPANSYAIGVDWNDVANGTRIAVLEWSQKLHKFRLVQKYKVSKEGWNQTAAVNKIVEVNRIWRPNYLYMDAGFGGMQVEVLKKIGIDAKYQTHEFSAVDATLQNVVAINFSARIEVPDPVTGEKTAKMMKPYMVENAIRRLEQGFFEFSENDESLYKQMSGYSIDRITPSGYPVYAAGPEGDHDLDAVMLGLLGFQLETSELLNPNYNAEIKISGKFGEPVNIISPVKPIVTSSRTSSLDVRETSRFGFSFPSDRIYSPAAFSADLRPKKDASWERGAPRIGRGSKLGRFGRTNF